jgi:enhancing lycopene biosynthesis protein 2
MKTNKEIIDALTEYFMDADKEVLARIVANNMIDFHRLRTVRQLPEQERECLLARMDSQEEQLIDFIKNGPKCKLKCQVVTTVQEVHEGHKKWKESKKTSPYLND